MVGASQRLVRSDALLKIVEFRPGNANEVRHSQKLQLLQLGHTLPHDRKKKARKKPNQFSVTVHLNPAAHVGWTMQLAEYFTVVLSENVLLALLDAFICIDQVESCRMHGMQEKENLFEWKQQR